MRGLPLLILLGACASAWSATVYKWVDDQGVVHFSDQPNPKAEKLQVSGAQTYGSAQAAVAAPSVSPTGRPPPPPVCLIDTPAPGSVLFDTFSITGHITLAHLEGSQPSLRMDGQDVTALLGSGGDFMISEIERGEHTLTLQVINDRGEVTCQGPSVTFAIRQRAGASTGAPTAPGAPAAPQAPMAPGVR
jgi:hypothetical protein